MQIEELTRNPNMYYFVCAAGIGDTMVVCSFYKALKKKYNSDIVLVVPETQKFIPQMFNIENYEVVDLGVKNIDELLCKYTKMSDMNPLPKKGEFYLCHFCFHNELQNFILPIYFRKSNKDFLTIYKEFLNLPIETPMEKIKSLPQLSEDTKKLILPLNSFEKIILFSPEATSTEMLPPKFWEQKAEELRQLGYTIISNVKNKDNTIKGTFYVPLSLEDAVALAYVCHSVYSIRSGFCDLCCLLSNKLHVYYANRDDLYLYSLKNMFNNNVNEYVEYNLPDKLVRGREINNFSEVNQSPLASEKLFQKKYYLFTFLNIYSVQICDNKKVFRLLGIPIIKIKSKVNKQFIYFLGIPVLKIKRKES